jgi:cephalosporin hydroxylase
MIFEDLYTIVEESGHESSFNREECEALYNFCQEIPRGGLVLEIGIQFGRSLTVLGIVGNERDFDIIGVDSWQEDVSQDAKMHVEEKIKKYDMPITVMNITSEEAEGELKFDRFDLVHIDGDHEYESVLQDIVLWSRKVKKGGYMCFDDYGHDSLPGVYKAVTEYMMGPHGKEWEFVGRFGDKLGVFKRNHA